MKKLAAFVASRVIAPALLFSMACASTAQAGEPVPNNWDGNWHYSITPYGWLPGISATMRYRLPEGSVESKTNGSIFDYLSGAFMLEFEARKNDWGIYTDLDWVKFSDEKGRFTSIGGDRVGANLGLDTRWGIKGGMFNVSALYSIGHSDIGYVDLIFGARYLWLKGNLDWNFNANGNAGNFNIATSGHRNNQMHVTDAIVGLKGAWTPFHDSGWFFPYYVDVGAGGSDSTFQLKAGVAYAFNWGNIALLYRDVEYHQSDSDNFVKKATLSGPAFSVTWNF
ncbi:MULTISPECIES: hypothetical protein [Dyella]|uniref:Outer membrane protein beta-barrel domain-containing protein n=2 Tax=Dyella TaxID=231454 RepID=A0A4V2NMF1_9GAMM|nr:MULTISPECIES: hypothetical protein [Dyella]TBR39345.1 hypothetical protein EYV96_03730 [Dyella terrae]TCI13067.1 hypothetical protein EZM97_07135 [Dyella soli]